MGLHGLFLTLKVTAIVSYEIREWKEVTLI
jgi:hypothetical protein